MFSRQAPQIHNALLQGGLAPAMASQTQNLLGQCQAGLVHRGPIQIDRTQPDMRLIDPATAKLRYPELMSLPSPPPQRPRQPGEEEEEVPKPDIEIPVGLPPPVVVTPPAPESPPVAGEYIRVEGRKVHLLHDDGSGSHCTFQGGRVKGVRFVTKGIGPHKDKIKLTFRDEAAKTVLEYELKGLRVYDIVTNISLGKDGIEITKEKILAWPGSGAGKTVEVLPVVECESDASGGSARLPEEEGNAEPREV